MSLSKNQIQDLNLIRDSVASGFREASYDLTVGEIYVPRGKNPKAGTDTIEDRARTTNEYVIPPKGVALVFSQEFVVLPAGFCGYAMPKTRLCDEGILVLNTGIVDPGWEGPISGTIINFRDTPYPIDQNTPFLRLVFERMESAIPDLLTVVSSTPEPVPVTLASAPATPPSAPVTPASAPVPPASMPVTPTSASVTPASAPVTPASTPVMPASAPVPPAHAPTATIPPASRLTPAQRMIRAEYVSRKMMLAQNFPNQFLDVEETARIAAKKASKRVVKEERTFLVRVFTIFGIVIGLPAVFYTIVQGLGVIAGWNKDNSAETLRLQMETVAVEQLVGRAELIGTLTTDTARNSNAVNHLNADAVASVQSIAELHAMNKHLQAQNEDFRNELTATKNELVELQRILIEHKGNRDGLEQRVERLEDRLSKGMAK